MTPKAVWCFPTARKLDAALAKIEAEELQKPSREVGSTSASRVKDVLRRASIAVPPQSYNAMVGDLTAACESRLVGVGGNGRRRGIGKIFVTNAVFMHDVRAALVAAGMRAGRWSDRENGNDGLGRESLWYVLAEGLAQEFGFDLPDSKRRVAVAASTVVWAVARVRQRWKPSP